MKHWIARIIFRAWKKICEYKWYFYKYPVLLSGWAFMLYFTSSLWLSVLEMSVCFDSCPLSGPAGPHQWYDHSRSLYQLTVQAQHKLHSVL